MNEETLKLLLAPVCIGLVEALKQAGLPTKYAPLASILFGGIAAIVLGFAFGHTGAALAVDLISGLGIGAAASGVYAVADQLGTTVKVGS